MAFGAYNGGGAGSMVTNGGRGFGGRRPFIKNDKFGNAYQVVKAWRNDAGYCKGHVELGGKLYAIEFNDVTKRDDKTGRDFGWVRVTLKPKRSFAGSM